MSVVQGGKFGHGFVNARLSQAANLSGLLKGGRAVSTAKAALLGGTVSELTGGKFANGAQTAAFSHLFNDLAAHAQEKRVLVKESSSSSIRGSVFNKNFIEPASASRTRSIGSVNECCVLNDVSTATTSSSSTDMSVLGIPLQVTVTTESVREYTYSPAPSCPVISCAPTNINSSTLSADQMVDFIQGNGGPLSDLSDGIYEISKQ